MNNPITFESLGFTSEREGEIKSLLSKIAPTDTDAQLRSWFPSAVAKREGHEIVLAAAHGFLTQEEVDEVKEDIENPEEGDDDSQDDAGDEGEDDATPDKENGNEDADGQPQSNQDNPDGQDDDSTTAQGHSTQQEEDIDNEESVNTDDHSAHADDETIRKALERLLGNGGKLPPRCPIPSCDPVDAKKALKFWLTNMSGLANEIKRRFVACARTERTRNCKTGKLSLRNTVKIGSDSNFVFDKKTKGTNRRVAFAGALDWSSSMNGFSDVVGRADCLLKLKKLAKLDTWFNEPLLAVTKRRNDCKIDACSVSIHGENGQIMGTGSGGQNFNSPAYGTVSLRYGVKIIASKRYYGDDPVGAKILMSFTLSYGQWVGANLIRKALTKLSIPNFWSGFTHNSYTIRDWNERGDINMPLYSFGLTNSACGFATMIDQLRTRNEERKIAILFTDGAVNHDDHVNKSRENQTQTNVESAKLSNKGNDLALSRAVKANKEEKDKLGSERVNDLIRQGWKQGIEIYVIGLNLQGFNIETIERVVGKGHVVSVQDIATELPAVIAEIIGNDPHDLKKTRQGKGYLLTN